MRLHGVCYYRSKSETWNDQWRDEDYSAMNLVKALKHLSFNGSSTIKQGSNSYLIENNPSGQARALLISARAIAGKLHNAGYENTAVIPIPSSSHTDPCQMFTGRRLVDAIQLVHGGYQAAPVLHFDEPLPKARGGGTRNPYVIQPHLRLSVDQLPASAVLVDDVCTSGGHLIAAARFLAARGLQIEDAFVVGRTTWDRPDSMFSVATTELDTNDGFNF